MSAPKRAAKTTSSRSKTAKKAEVKTPAPKSAAAKPAKAAAKKAAAKPAPKPTAKAAKKATAKAAAKSTAKPTVKAAKPAKPSAAERVAKKVAKIISKIVAKKKTVAKKPAASASAPVKAAAKAGKPKAKAATKAPAKLPAKPAKAAVPAAKAKPAKTKAAPSRRPKSFASRDVERDFGFPANAPELPDSYGEDRLVLMTKDPEYLFAYWEITPEKKAEGEQAKHRREDYREALRLNWASRDIFERNFAVMPVSLDARKWYLRVPFSGLAYQVEIGWLGDSGHFISLLTSNPSDAPESWAATRRRLKAAGQSGGILKRALAGGRPQGSSELTSKGAPAAPAPHDWNFPGPLSQTSSFGAAKKPGRRAAP